MAAELIRAMGSSLTTIKQSNITVVNAVQVGPLVEHRERSAWQLQAVAAIAGSTV